MTTKLLATAAVLLGAAALLSCATSNYDSSMKLGPILPGNVHLYISNESTDPSSTVVPCVFVDGECRVRRSMRSVWADPHGPHDVPHETQLYLAPGSHTIRVVAVDTTASAEMQIVVGDAPVHVSAAFGVGSFGPEQPSSEATVTIHVLPGEPGSC